MYFSRHGRGLIQQWTGLSVDEDYKSQVTKYYFLFIFRGPLVFFGHYDQIESQVCRQISIQIIFSSLFLSCCFVVIMNHVYLSSYVTKSYFDFSSFQFFVRIIGLIAKGLFRVKPDNSIQNYSFEIFHFSFDIFQPSFFIRDF